MRTTKTVSWNTKKGQKVEVAITKTKGVQDKKVNLDGDIVKLGKETVDSLYIEIKVDGKYNSCSYNAPTLIDPLFTANYDQLKAAGAHANLGNAYITEEQHNMIMATIEELDQEMGEEEAQEYAEVKVGEKAEESQKEEAEKKEIANYERLKKSGLCPKCGTWCYGDCEAN